MNKPTLGFLLLLSIPFTVFVYQTCGKLDTNHPVLVMWTMRGIFLFLEILIILIYGYKLLSRGDKGK
jgi:hypothetical protein